MTIASSRSVLLFLIGVLLPETAMRAETETATLDISAIVPATCTVGQMSLDLGVIRPNGATDVLARSALNISCPAETPYRISIDESAPSVLVSKAGSAQIPYTIAILDVGSKDPSGQPSAPIVEIRARPTGDEPAGSYSQEIRLRLDW